MAVKRSVAGDAEFLRLVLEKAVEGAAHAEMPFAAGVVKEGDLIACEHSQVNSTGDPTAQAELLAIRSAAEKLGSADLSGCTLYCSCEPNLMGFGAAHLAKISRLVYGATIGDAALAGYDQVPIFVSQLKIMGRAPIEIVPELLRDEAVRILAGR